MPADGDATTAWCPNEADASPWLMLDIERTLKIKEVMVDCGDASQRNDIVNGDASQASYEVELSADGQQWKPFTPMTKARFIRLKYQQNKKPNVAEIKVTALF